MASKCVDNGTSGSSGAEHDYCYARDVESLLFQGGNQPISVGRVSDGDPIRQAYGIHAPKRLCRRGNFVDDGGHISLVGHCHAESEKIEDSHRVKCLRSGARMYREGSVHGVESDRLEAGVMDNR